MKKVKIFPCPHMEMRLYLSDDMIEDFKRCQNTNWDDISEGKVDIDPCEHCSWNSSILEGVGICTMHCIEDKMQEMIRDGKI